MIHRPTRLFALLVLGVLGSALLAGCRDRTPADDLPQRRPFIVIGIDGGEWKVIRDLWAQGKLAHLNALAQRGVTTYLRTDYGLSPVIWTTIATGMKPEEHGIFDFVVPTARGDAQVSTTVRRVPAIWNMLSQADRRVAVLGWLISWPAEEVNGVVVSSRALLKVRRRVFPEDFLPRVEQAAEEGPPNPFVAAGNREADYTMTRLGRRLAAEGYDLLLIYLRGVDSVCHQYWKEYRPQDFPDAPPSAADVARYGDRIPREYEAVDWAIGRILAAARPEPNVLVISDHGFGPAETEIVRVVLNFDRVLQRLGYQARKRGGMDWARTQLYCHASPNYRATKWVRFALAGREKDGRVRPEERPAIRSRLEADLARITYGSGEPAFEVRDAGAEDLEHGADFVVEVRLRSPTPELFLDGDPEPLAGAIAGVNTLTGAHTSATDGIFIAAGPDVEPGAPLARIHIHDVTPTLLYGLGLPVAENFAGEPRVELFTAAFRDAHPVRTIAAWGLAREGFVTTSEEDEAIREQLGALGYLE